MTESQLPASEPEPAPAPSDAEREPVIGRLRDSYAQGQLSFEEFNRRMNTALVTRSPSELERVTADLIQAPGTPLVPGPPQSVGPPIGAGLINRVALLAWVAAAGIGAVVVVVLLAVLVWHI